MKRIFLGLLAFYRYVISPMLGNHCRFIPSCSEYAQEAIETHGPWKGVWIAAKRLGRCHPFCDGGYDPVPGTEEYRRHCACQQQQADAEKDQDKEKVKTD